MRPPTIDPTTRRDTVEFTEWRDLPIDIEHAWGVLTSRGWKIDTEESNLMVAFSRTWRAEGIKVWVRLRNFVCAPPADEDMGLDTICFYRFDPAAMPTSTMLEQMLAGHATEPPPTWYEDWQWLIDHGDPQFDTFELLQPIAFGEVPRALLMAAWADLKDAIDVRG